MKYYASFNFFALYIKVAVSQIMIHDDAVLLFVNQNEEVFFCEGSLLSCIILKVAQLPLNSDLNDEDVISSCGSSGESSSKVVSYYSHRIFLVYHCYFNNNST